MKVIKPILCIHPKPLSNTTKMSHPETNSPNNTPNADCDKVHPMQIFMGATIIQEYEALFGNDAVRRRRFRQQYSIPQQSNNPPVSNVQEEDDERIEIETCSSVTEDTQSTCRNLSTEFNEEEFPDISYLTNQ